MNNKEMLREELRKHRQKMSDLIVQLHQNKTLFEQAAQEIKRLEDEINFERGVIQALEFSDNLVPTEKAKVDLRPPQHNISQPPTQPNG